MNLIEFGTISHIKKGKKPLRQIDKPQDGYRPYVDIEAFETGNIKMYTDGEKCLPCKAGDILIVCDGSRSGFVGKAIDGYVGSTLAIISADGMSQEYLYYFLQGKYALLNTKKKGTGTPHLDANILNQQKLVVPSLEEQQRVVARIEELFSELDNGVETLKKTKQQLAVYRQAVLKEAFDIETDTVEISSIVEDIRIGPFGTVLHKEDYIDGGIPVMGGCASEINQEYWNYKTPPHDENAKETITTGLMDFIGDLLCQEESHGYTPRVLNEMSQWEKERLERILGRRISNEAFIAYCTHEDYEQSVGLRMSM